MKKLLIAVLLCVSMQNTLAMIHQDETIGQTQIKLFRSINRIIGQGYAFKTIELDQLLCPEITFVKKTKKGCKYVTITQNNNAINIDYTTIQKEKNLGLSKFLRTVKHYTQQNGSEIEILSSHAVVVKNSKKKQIWYINVDRHGRITREEERLFF